MNKKLLRKKLALMLASLKKKRPYYCEVEYLQSTGTQYIDTGIAGSSTLKIEMNGQKTGASLGVYFGAGTGNSRIQAVYLNGYNSARIGDISIAQLGPDSEKFNIVVDALNKNVIYDGTSYPFAYTSALTNLNIFIFTRNEGSSYADKATAKCWLFKIWDNGTLVRDFIPVLDWDYVPCMYDKVTGQLFYNAGTGNFTAGREIHQVDYIEGTGTQYIDTGLKGNLNTKIETKIYADMSVTHYAIVGDFTTSTSAITIPINTIGGSGLYSRFGNKAITSGLGHTTGTYKIYVDKTGYYSDDVLRGTFNTTTAFTTTNTMMLFGFTGLGRNYLVGKMYYCKIWDGTTLVGDYVPAIDENGVGFLFDRVSHTIHDNIGTDAFLYPPVELDYLESSGTQYIDTGINANSSLGFDMTYQLNDLTSTSMWWGAIRQTGSSTYLRHHPSIESTTQYYRYYLHQSPVATLQKDTDKHNIQLDSVNKVFTVDGTSSGISFGTFDCNLNYFLFARNQYLNNTSTIEYANMKFYRCKLYNLSVLVRDFIPCYKDGVLGFLNKVDGTFFTNSGTGQFLAGKIIEERYE